MLCTQPFVRDPSGKIFKTFKSDEFYKGIPFPCGHCLACRRLRQRRWTLRLILESSMYVPSDIRFVTLTYTDDNLIHEIFGHKPILWLKDIQDYIKRLRYYVPSMRYFVGAEYGTKTDRPHYHCILFGFPSFLDSYVSNLWYRGKTNHLGFTSIGYDTSVSALAYTAGYVAKKVGRSCDRPKQFREFAIQSRKPAIGMPFLEKLRIAFEGVKSYGSSLPTALNIGGRSYPLDRTLSNALYRYFYTDMDASTEEHLWSMASRFFADSVPEFHGFGKLADGLIDESAQRNLQIKALTKIYGQGTL